ncbi:MAG: recombinase family protein [Phycisphaerae bacterium]|nr:recombinase family protein [Phycisphaerae bacterium]
MLNFAFGQSKYYSDILSVNIKRAQRQKTSEGVWGWKAPVGYLNDPKTRTVVIDPEKSELVRRLFQLYASGQYTIDRLRDTMNAEGLRSFRNGLMSHSVYQDILKNPFYYGVFRLKGEMFEGAHEALISKEVFDTVQAVMTRRSKPHPVGAKNYVYRGHRSDRFKARPPRRGLSGRRCFHAK